MSITEEIVITWFTLGLVTFVIDCVMVRRRLAGKLGHQVRAEYEATFRRYNGLPGMLFLAVIADLILMPVGLWSIMASHNEDWHTFEAEKKRAYAAGND